MEEWIMPYRLTELNDEMKDRAVRELGETPEVKIRALADIRRYVREQENLVCADDDEFFLAFLRKAKYDTKRTIKLMESYFREKKNFPEIFSTPNFAGLQKCLEMRLASVMPYRDRDGSSILVFRAENWNVEEIKFPTIMHFMTVALLGTVEYEPSQVCGVKSLISFKGISLSHIRHIHLRYLALMARGIRSCVPVRLKGVHIINDDVHIRFLWNFVSFYVGNKLRNRIHFHGTDHKGILNFIDPEVIPTDFGGNFNDDPSFGLSELDYTKDNYFKRMSSGYR